jgi:hypothetical protein
MYAFRAKSIDRAAWERGSEQVGQTGPVAHQRGKWDKRKFSPIKIYNGLN